MKHFTKKLSALLSVPIALSVSITCFASSVTYNLSEKTKFTERLDRAVDLFYGNSSCKGDFDSNNSVSAKDARNILRAAAKIDNSLTDYQNFICDVNCDNKITSADARLALRIAAKIDNTTPEISKKLELFNSLVNSVKPSEVNTIYYYKNCPVSITYDNQQAVDNFNSEMRSLANNAVIKASFTNDELNELKNMDLGKMLTETDDEDISVKYRQSGYFANRLSVDFPIAGNKYASVLSVNDIKSIDYSESDSTVFNIYSALQGSFDKVIAGPYNINGASITVYFNDESISSIPDNQTELSHGKAFNLNLDNNSSLSSSISPNEDDEISTNGQFTGELDTVKYSDSYIKIYFNNDKLSANYMKPVFIEYNLNYTTDVYTHIVLSMTLKIIGINVDIDDYITVSSNMNELTQYYFIGNTD